MKIYSGLSDWSRGNVTWESKFRKYGNGYLWIFEKKGIGSLDTSCLTVGGGDKWVKSQLVIWIPPGLFSG